MNERLEGMKEDESMGVLYNTARIVQFIKGRSELPL
jgi:hypothetical protein